MLVGMHKQWLWPGSTESVMTVHFTFALSLPYDIWVKSPLCKPSIKEHSLQFPPTKFNNHYIPIGYTM